MTAWKIAQGNVLQDHQAATKTFSLPVQCFDQVASLLVTPEQRAKAVVEHFNASLPPAVRPQLEKVIASAITRALRQQLAELEKMASAKEERAHGRGKSAKGHDPAAIHFHREWKERFRAMGNGAGAA